MLIDIQNDCCSPGGGSDKTGADMSLLGQVTHRVKPVLEAARQCGILVVHIQQTHLSIYLAESGAWLRMRYNIHKRAGSEAADLHLPLVVEGTWGWQEVDEVAPRPGEAMVRKHRSSAFIGTDLDVILRSNEIKSVVCVGVVTEGCVESTARHAQFCDYYSILLQDCVGTSKAEIHEAALLVMRTRLDVIDSSKVLNIWAK